MLLSGITSLGTPHQTKQGGERERGWIQGFKERGRERVRERGKGLKIRSKSSSDSVCENSERTGEAQKGASCLRQRLKKQDAEEGQVDTE